jgi:glycosyltransferase involved in cell wall biosynthesis
MTILEYITPSRLGGAEEYFLRLVGHALRQGHRVVVVTKRDCALRGELEKRAQTWPSELRQRFSLQAWRTRGKFDAPTLSRLVRLIRRERVDVVHTHLTTASWNGALAARLARVPSVAHVHGLDSKTWFQHADYQVAVARAVKAHLVAQGVPSPRVRVSFVGLDVEAYQPREREEARAELGLEWAPGTPGVGVVASLIERKGHRFLLDALHQLQDEFPDARLLIAGEGPLEGALREQTQRLGLGERVEFLGFRRDVDRVVSACDVVVLPSLKEGLSIAAMEAMALGRPVVATAIAGMPELLQEGETGALVPPGDADALARVLRGWWRDPAKAQRVALGGRDFVRMNFEQRACLDDTLGFLAEVVESWRDGARLDCDHAPST